MLILGIITVLLVPFILGSFVISLVLRSLARQYGLLEKIGLSFLLGIGYLTLMMYILGLCHIPITFLSVIISVALAIIVCTPILAVNRLFFFSLSELKAARLPKMSLFEWTLTVLIGLKMAFIFFSALVKSMMDIDAFQQYTIVAKAVFFDHSFTLPYLRGNIGDKPLFTYLSQAWVFLGLNTINDAMVKIIAPLLFVCLLAIFYCRLRNSFDRLPSLLFTFLLSTLPFMVYHATTAYSDVAITVFFSLGTIYLFEFMKKPEGEKALPDLTIAFILLALTIWTKRAGVMLVFIDLLVLASFMTIIIKKLDIKRITVPLLIFIITIGPWLAFGFSHSTTYTEVSKSMLGLDQTQIKPESPQPPAEPSLGERIANSLSIFGRKLFLYSDWHLLYLLLFATMVFYYGSSFSRPNVFLLTIIFLDIFIIFAQFQSKEMYRWLLDGTLLDRLLMDQAPVILYFCAMAIFGSKKK